MFSGKYLVAYLAGFNLQVFTVRKRKLSLYTARPPEQKQEKSAYRVTALVRRKPIKSKSSIPENA